MLTPIVFMARTYFSASLVAWPPSPNAVMRALVLHFLRFVERADQIAEVSGSHEKEAGICRRV
ncbi:hypothetical protein WS54_20615 [Burkholderia sp. NRF60-BP8]|nr:hypothetical protein WS54_20615 [Burkholderia sp. NRF60-BP8]KVL11504.1 hypothetical protein WS95_27160 [Burkholderia sp. MSMB1826]